MRITTSRDVDCPVCGARAGERCHGSGYSGRAVNMVDYHTARRELARARRDATSPAEVICRLRLPASAIGSICGRPFGHGGYCGDPIRATPFMPARSAVEGR